MGVSARAETDRLGAGLELIEETGVEGRSRLVEPGGNRDLAGEGAG